MGIFQEVIAKLFPKEPRLAPGAETIDVTVLFGSDEFGDILLNSAPFGSFEHVIEAAIYKSPSAQYPRSIRVEHAKSGTLIGYVMPSNWDKAHKLIDEVLNSGVGGYRIKIDCAVFGFREGDGVEVVAIELQYESPFRLL